MEIRMQEVVLVGRMVGNPIARSDGTYFRFQADKDQSPIPCVCDGKTADNLRKYCQAGDEFCIEGKLQWRKFRNTGDTLLVYVRYTSYGRKLKTLRRGSGN